MKNSYIEVDLNSWDRRDLYQFFLDFENSAYSFTVELDITEFFYCHKERATLSAALLHVLSKAVNSTDNFLLREENGKVIKWQFTDPGITVALDNHLFNFCFIPYKKDFNDFLPIYKQKIAICKQRKSLLDTSINSSAVFYTTSTPWLHFSSMTHPMRESSQEKIPKFAWSKCEIAGNKKVNVSLNLQIDHKFIDAIHVSQLIEKIKINILDLTF